MQLPYHYMHQGLECTSSNIMSQSSAVVSWDCLVDSFASPPWAMCMLLDDIQWRWSCHHSQQGLDGDTLWYTQSQRTAAAKLVARLALIPYSRGQCWCSIIICNDDGSALAIPSHLPRIGVHILQHAVIKFSCSELRLLGRSLCLSFSSNVDTPWWPRMTMKLSSQPARIGRWYPLVYSFRNHIHSQVCPSSQSRATNFHASLGLLLEGLMFMLGVDQVCSDWSILNQWLPTPPILLDLYM